MRYQAPWRDGLLMLAMAGLSWGVMAEEQREKTRKPRDESWQIEQRQRWFSESRGLQTAPDARREREKATSELRSQVARRMSTTMLAGEVWQELGPSAMTMGNWTMGRVSGRNNAIVPHPGDENTVYFGSAAGGVWKTTNGGASWTSLFDQVGTLPIGAIHLEAQNANAVWVGTGDKNGGGCAGYFGQGLFLSNDGGNSWQARNGSGATAMPLSIINSVAVQPNNNQVVLAGGAGTCDSGGSLSNAGLYRSVDRGATWSRTLSGKVEDLVFAPGSATVYAAVAGSGVYRSTDGGANWTSASSGISVSGTRMRLAMAPSNSQTLYVLQGSSLYRTTDGASSWTLRNGSACEGQCTYNQALAVHPTQPNTVLVGSIRFARSTDGGTTLSYLTSGWGSSQKVHQDTHVLVYSGTNGNRFWVGSDGGIWRSDDGGTNYVNMNANLNVTQFYDVAVHPDNNETVFGGAQDNSSSRRAGNKVWDLTLVTGDGFMNVVDASNANTVLQAGYPSGGYPNINRSTTGGAPNSFSGLSTTGLTSSGNFPWVTPLAGAGSRVFVASDKVYRGTASANPFSWTSISTSLGSAVSVLTPMQRGSAYPTYVGTSGGRIHYSADAGAGSVSWSDVTGNYPGGRVSDLAMDPGNPLRVFATRAAFGGGKLFRSTSGGTSWQTVGSGLPNVPANTVAVDPLNTNRIYVGTDVGVYESSDGGDNFVAFSAGLPLGLVVMDLEIDNAPYALVAGTYGRGAWRVNLGTTGNQPPTAAFSHSVSGLSVSFTDTSTDADGSIAARAWDFGDGTTSTQANPNKTYAAAGSYTVTLTATDNQGASASTSKTLTLSSGGCVGTSVNGSFTGANNQSQIQPSSGWYQSTASGTHGGCLAGPAGTDFDLYLDKWNGSSWNQVAKSDSPSNTETVSYSGAAGYYRYRVVNYSGTGAYTLTYSRP